ncbi:hypothetical protein DSUL_30129 [Desulfovibrionales bacterium]
MFICWNFFLIILLVPPILLADICLSAWASDFSRQAPTTDISLIPPAVDLTGTWKSSYFFSQIVMDIKQTQELGPGYFNAVVQVYELTGNVITYHISGFIRNTIITAVHGSGATFVGNLTSPFDFSGTLTTVRNYTIPLRASRTQQERR